MARINSKDEFMVRCDKLNSTLKDVPSKDDAMRIYRMVYNAYPVARYYYRRKVFYCSECGSEVQWIGQKKCPCCGTKWTMQPQPQKDYMDKRYHLVLEAHGDIQVCRLYRVERNTRFGKEADRRVWEVERMMYSPKGQRVLFAKNVQCMGMYYDAFSFSSDITYKQEKNLSYKAEHRYNLMAYSASIKSLTKQWQYKDIPWVLANYDYDTYALRLIAKPYGETLLKTGHKDVFDYLLKEHKELSDAAVKALNICTRNKYKITDFPMWLDNLDLLVHFGYDTHSPKYVCPTNLRKVHSKLIDRKDEEDKAHRWQKKMKEKSFAKMVNTWHEHMGKILTLDLKGKNLNIRPLQNVAEFKEEADAMHHCVFANEYFDYRHHPNSLILSAKDDNGNRLATIEYNKKSEKIEQCRAACNAVPERDTEIRNLINSNKATFDKLLKAA